MMYKSIKDKQLELRKAVKSDLTGDMKVQAMCLTTLLGELDTLSKKGKDVDDVLVMQVIKKSLKSNKEMQLYNTDALVARELFLEVNILESFMPKQLTESELRDIIGVTLSACPDANMGQIMGNLKSTYNGQYDGKMASTIIKEML